jgi:hypothetical protein
MAQLLSTNVAGDLVVTGNIAFSRSGTQLPNIPQITVGTTAPTSPRVNDLWIDTN